MDANDPGVGGKKLSKSSDGGFEIWKGMMSKYYDRQIAWIKDPTYDNLIAYRHIGDEIKRLYER